MISALSSALTTGAILNAGIITYRELDEFSNARHLEALDRLIDEFRFGCEHQLPRRIYVDPTPFFENPLIYRLTRRSR